jgi:hypothetical protein
MFVACTSLGVLSREPSGLDLVAELELFLRTEQRCTTDLAQVKGTRIFERQVLGRGWSLGG